eukprot:10730238-Alexandrium_andersonii.AAC.1
MASVAAAAAAAAAGMAAHPGRTTSCWWNSKARRPRQAAWTARLKPWQASRAQRSRRPSREG